MSRKPKLLVIDDGDRYIELAHQFLRDYEYATRCSLPGPCWECPQRKGCTLTHAHDSKEADEALARHSDVEVVLLDMAFELPPDRLLPLPAGVRAGKPGHRGASPAATQKRLQGLSILGHLRRSRGELPVILMTSQEELGDAAQVALPAGDELVTLAGSDAFDARALGLLIERLLVQRQEAPSAGGYLFGRSAAMAQLRREALVLARTSLPVLVLGETGTGKSALCQKVLHAAVPRSGPFVSVDLSAIPETVVAAELFGTARGAFSGAVEREGRFERASGGTLLLDEIGNLPLDVQRMLLLVLQEGRVTRLGENTARPVQVKLVAATQVDLVESVRTGRFRADLYARLNPAARLLVPPLRERREDLEPLLLGLLQKTFATGENRQLLIQYCEAAGLQPPQQIELVLGRRPPPRPPQHGVRFVLSPLAMKAIYAHRFPGNVRELEMLIGNATLFALADALQAAESERAVPAAAHTIPIPNQLIHRLLKSGWPQGPAAGPATGAESAAAPPSESQLLVNLRRHRTLHAAAKDFERQVYAALYEEHGDFQPLAERLLTGSALKNARRVQLRFNQLGLRVRHRRKISES